MNAALEKLTQQALALPAEERAALANLLVESLDPAPSKEIEALWAAEAVRRRDEVRSGAVKPVSREEARERIGRIVP